MNLDLMEGVTATRQWASRVAVLNRGAYTGPEASAGRQMATNTPPAPNESENDARD